MHTTYVPDRDLCMLIERFDKSRDGRIAYHEVSLIVPNLVVHFRNDPQLNYYFIIVTCLHFAKHPLLFEATLRYEANYNQMGTGPELASQFQRLTLV